MSGARLYGVGVGPGAPDLLTLRAASVLRGASVLAAPRSSPKDASLALRITREAVGEVLGQETLLLEFPMCRDLDARRTARHAAVGAIAERLARGLSVAFVAEGDPLVYSTFLELLRQAPRAFPGIPVEIVPGVSSITAVAAAARVPLAEGDGKLAIVPAGAALADLAELAREFETLLLFKAGPVLPSLRAALVREGLIARAWLICNATIAGERVVQNLATFGGRCGYFSTVLVSREVAP